MAMAVHHHHHQFRFSSPSSPALYHWHPSFHRDGSYLPSLCVSSFSSSNTSSSPSSSSAARLTSSFPLRVSSSSSSSSSSTAREDLINMPKLSENGGNGGFGDGNGNKDGHGGGNGDGNGDEEGNGGGMPVGKAGLFSAFLRGWNDRLSADPQFPFKVLMEEVVGVGACVIGDMASRPNFGLNELDFVFSTIVVGSILNFSLMYMLAPTSLSHLASSRLPFIFANCPSGYMFEQGSYTLAQRLGTFVYKGAVFASVGFFAGLLGTNLSNLLIGMRKKMDPSFKAQNKAPPTILNAATWAMHMGFSSNLRYQAINGMEFGMAKVLSPNVFKLSVFFTRALNNVLGGMSFVALARVTGSQVSEKKISGKCTGKGECAISDDKGSAISSIELQALPVISSEKYSLGQQNQEEDKARDAAASESSKQD